MKRPNGRHVIVEYGAGRLIGIEIKVASAPRADAAKHLRWLRGTLGDGFAGGLVLHTGRHAYPLDHDITAAPISTIWTGPDAVPEPAGGRPER